MSVDEARAAAKLRAGRDTGLGAEARWSPRSLRAAAAAAAAAATLGGEPRGAQPEQVCRTAPGAPPALSPRGRRCRGSSAACKAGVGGTRVRSTRRPPGPRRGVTEPGPSAGSLWAGALRGRQRLLGASQAGRAPGWEESCKPGLGEGSGCSAGRSEPGRKGAWGRGARSPSSARTGGDSRGEQQLSPEGGQVPDWRGWCGCRGTAFSDTTVRLGQISEGELRESASPAELAKAYFFFIFQPTERNVWLSNRVLKKKTCRLFSVSASSTPSSLGSRRPPLQGRAPAGEGGLLPLLSLVVLGPAEMVQKPS